MAIPDRWIPYSPMGSIVPGTRFIACKVPLKQGLLQKLPENARFGPKDIIEAFPKVGLLIDLTNTTRYYSKQDFTEKNIRYEKIFCPGRVIPPNSIIKEFFHAVDNYLAAETDEDAVIVVHCTHGVNRTGYFICRYMIEKLNMTPEEALKNFQMARGHDIERDNYVNDLKNGCKGGNESDLRFVSNGRFKNDRRNNGRNISNTKRRFPATESDGNVEMQEKRYKKYPYQTFNNARGGKKRSHEKPTHTFFDNSDVQRIMKDESKYSYNWRDHGNISNPPPKTTKTLQFTPTHHQVKHQENKYSNNWRDHGNIGNPPPQKTQIQFTPTHHQVKHQPRNPRPYQELPQGRVFDTRKFPQAGDFSGTHPMNYVEHSRNFPKCGYPGTSVDIPSSRRAEDSSLGNSCFASGGYQQSTAGFKGSARGRTFSRGGGGSRGRRSNELQRHNLSR